jgi:F-type H+-transporting ATPase subunit a
MLKAIIYTVVALVIIVIGNILLPVPRAAIEVAAEPIFHIGPFVVTNAFFTSILISITLLIIAFFLGRNLKERPGGLQNVTEMLIEALDNLVNATASKKWAATFFPIVATIFIWVLFANYTSLFTPLFGSFGIVHLTDHGGQPIESITLITGDVESLEPLHGDEDKGGDEGGEEHAAPEAVIIPLFRAPSSDLNMTFALAITVMVLVQVFGFRERGIGYLGHFIRIDGFKKKGIGLGLIDFFLGLVELISELAKILSFSFRLFGNIFAGEVLMIVIIALVTLLVLVAILGLEIFVGTIQAFVFFILALVFFSIATQHHGEEH